MPEAALAILQAQAKSPVMLIRLAQDLEAACHPHLEMGMNG